MNHEHTRHIHSRTTGHVGDMRITIAGIEYQRNEERYMDDKGWSFKKAFEKAGISVDVYVYRKKGNLSFIERKKYVKELWHSFMNRNLVSHVQRTRPDVLLVLKGETITPETLWHIRKKTDTLLVNVFPDNPLFIGKFEAIEPYHYFFVKDSYVVGTIRKTGLRNTLYLPQCTDLDVHKPMDMSSKERAHYAADVALLGSRYAYRETLVEQLAGFGLSLWGKGWERSSNKEILRHYRGKDIRGTSKAKAFCAAAISLNPHHPLNDIHGVNRRTFDIAACRGFQLADYKHDMDTVFKVNEEIVCFNTMDELKNFISYYLGHPEEREQIAAAAHRRVIRDHTYDVRAGQILDIIGGR
ncbi:MAG TPA: glycosyltransferase [Dissulfurispiraceae bacterium]|nr:glycosyltransferase [Dissulfurispiraceae bacterium]